VRPSFGFSVGRVPASELARRRPRLRAVRTEGLQVDSPGLPIETYSTPLLGTGKWLAGTDHTSRWHRPHKIDGKRLLNR